MKLFHLIRKVPLKKIRDLLIFIPLNFFQPDFSFLRRNIDPLKFTIVFFFFSKNGSYEDLALHQNVKKSQIVINIFAQL